jgi:hypothetical protein
MDKQALQEFLDLHGELRARGVWAKNLKREINHNEETLKWTPKPKEKSCEDCNQIVIDRIIEYKLINIGRPNQRYQKKCSECKQYLGRSKSID